MTKDSDKAARRAIIEDLVRIVAEAKKLLNHEVPVLHRPGPRGGWSLAELGLHIVLILEDCQQRFEGAMEADFQAPPPASFGQILTQKAILTTFRYPSKLLAKQNLLPKVMLTPGEIYSRLEEAMDRLLVVESALYSKHKVLKVEHPRFGPMSFFHWVRLLLIHVLHHKALTNKDLR